MSLANLARELKGRAGEDARFERSAALASELETELAAVTGRSVARRTRRRAVTTESTRRTSSRLFKAFQAECEALGTTLERVQEQGNVLSTQQLSDLRLGERTRRVFQAAGLLHVQDVTSLPPEQVMDIPQMAPASLAELRAAIMFASETAGNRHRPILPEPGADNDLFEGLVQVVNQLPARERETVVLRTGVEDRVHDVEDVARAIGCPPEQVDALEQHALNLLLSQPAGIEACWRLEALCAHLGLGWDDGRLSTVVAELYPRTRATFTRLVLRLMREKGGLVAEANGQAFQAPGGVAHFDEMVVAALGRYGAMTSELLTNYVRNALSPTDREHYPEIAVTERVRVLGPAVEVDDGTLRLPDAPIPGVEDRHIRALNGMIGALQKLGTARIAALTNEVNRRMPRQYRVSDQYIRRWLTQHPDVFVQSEADRYKLAAEDVDILCGMASAWLPGTAPAVMAAASKPGSVVIDRLRGRVAVEIAQFLKREGPQPIWRIRSHLYGRYTGMMSADGVIAAYPQRFVRGNDGLVSLDSKNDASELFEVDVAGESAPRFMSFWRRH